MAEKHTPIDPVVIASRRKVRIFIPKPKPPGDGWLNPDPPPMEKESAHPAKDQYRPLGRAS